MKVLLYFTCAALCLACCIPSPPGVTSKAPVPYEVLEEKPDPVEPGKSHVIVLVDEQTPKAKALELGEWLRLKYGSDLGSLDILDSRQLWQAMNSPHIPRELSDRHWLAGYDKSTGGKVIWLAKTRDH